jgi:hypothetical protein
MAITKATAAPSTPPIRAAMLAIAAPGMPDGAVPETARGRPAGPGR